MDVDVTESAREPVGDLGEEAAKLFAAAQQWWRESHGESASAAHPHDSHLGPECAICPLCQLLSRVRSARPEVFDHLSGAVVALMRAASATFEHHDGSWSRPEGAPTVERIDIR